MKGDTIEAPVKPQVYDKNNTFNHCLKNELVTTFHKPIGCHPPLISENKGKMFNKTLILPGQDKPVKQAKDCGVEKDRFSSWSSKLSYWSWRGDIWGTNFNVVYYFIIWNYEAYLNMLSYLFKMVVFSFVWKLLILYNP